MRRWNGWGDENTTYPLPDSAARYLHNALGPGQPTPDVDLGQVVATVPASRLWNQAFVTTDPVERLRHARGQSIPDWIAMRSGQIDHFPDAVAYPNNLEDVVDVLGFARESEIVLIPYGGGTSVVGHINPLPSERPVLTVDMSHMNQLVEFDETSHLATFEAGVCGPDLEAQLNARGYTLGHFPQSFELSTLGGWIASRSSGQQSLHYGRIEDLFAAGHVETPLGSLILPPYPASAAGPDLRQMILGSEGRLGIITHASVRIRPLAEAESFYGVFFKDWPSGVEAVRQAVQEGIGLSMLRLSNPLETTTTLELSGHTTLVGLANSGLSLLGYGPGRCMLIFGVTGSTKRTSQARAAAMAVFRAHGGTPAIGRIGEMWSKSRFLSPYLRNTLWERGYAVETVETALSWSQIPNLGTEIIRSLENAMEGTGERLLAFAHLSHVYQDGASTYVTFIFRRGPDPQATLRRWKSLKRAASLLITKLGGTISHQHGVGRDHAPYLQKEKGLVGMKLLRTACQTVDPNGYMNPGKLVLPGRSVMDTPVQQA